VIDFGLYPNFSADEFNCSHCGKNEMQAEFMSRLQALRMRYGKPMKITSGYRCPEHPIEAKKAKPGAHASGLACDVGVDGQQAYELMKDAFALGFTGIGVSQKGSGSRFIHLDMLEEAPRPNIWSY
jgi:zinc D-Ala-D-Ala carboxypeptidase